jgi:hypothetical protein
MALGIVILSMTFLCSLGGCGSGGAEERGKEAASTAETTSRNDSSALPGKAHVTEEKLAQRGAAATAKERNEAGDGTVADEGVDARRWRKICPKGLTRAECRAAARELAQPSPSHTMDDPRDCLATMSKEQCESLAKAVAGTQTGGSVNVEECVKHPTPHCEEVLRPALEAMYAAHQAGK